MASMEEVPFPDEVWLEIFKWIDIPRLMELRLVCHRFYDLIEDLLNKNQGWKKKVHEEILRECLETTMQRAYPYDLVSCCRDILDPVMWRGTYLSYKKWQKVLVNPHTQDTIVTKSNIIDVSYICTFDKYIAIAYDDGSIASYTIDDISHPFYVADHGTDIIQVEFWYSEGDVLVVSVGEDYALKFWDLRNKIEIATNGLFANSISSGECRHFCIGDMGGILTSYERVGNHIYPGSTLNLIDDHQQIIAHAVDGKRMTALAWDDSVLVQSSYHGEIEGRRIKLILDQKRRWDHIPENLRATLGRIIMPATTFYLEIGEHWIGSTYNNGYDTYKSYNMHILGCNVKSIAVHAQILILGLEDGSLRLLYIPHYRHLDLREGIKHSRKIQVDTEPIDELTILEVDKKPCIVAATYEKVHFINFF